MTLFAKVAEAINNRPDRKALGGKPPYKTFNVRAGRSLACVVCTAIV